MSQLNAEVEISQEGFAGAFGMDELTARFAHEVYTDSLTVGTATAYRERARQEKDFKTADFLRDWLIAQGNRVRDKTL